MYNPLASAPMPMPGMPDMGAPDMKGTWTNRRTGQTVMVRDVVIMDESMSVMLADGSMMDMNEFSRDYIQMSDEVYDDKGNVVGHDHTPFMPPHPHEPHMPSMHAPIHEHHHHHAPMPNVTPRPELHTPGVIPPHAHPMPPMHDPLHTPVMPNPHHPHHHLPALDSPIDDQKHNVMMLHHLFDKVKPEIKPDLSVEVDDKFPKDQLQMLIDIYGVTIEDIAIHIFKHYFTPEAMITAISEWLTNEQGLKDVEDNAPIEDSDAGTGTTTMMACQVDGSFANSSAAIY